MKYLNKKAAEIFKQIADICEASEDKHVKIKNNSSFMPLSVELLYECSTGKVFSFAHYYEQNGDLVPDPDMTFLQLVTNPLVIIPLTYQDLWRYTEACFLQGESWKQYPHLVKDLVIFANMWMRNIKAQQLDERRAA